MSLPQTEPRPDLHNEAETWSVDRLLVLRLAPDGIERSVGKARRIVDERDLRP